MNRIINLPLTVLLTVPTLKLILNNIWFLNDIWNIGWKWKRHNIIELNIKIFDPDVISG